MKYAGPAHEAIELQYGQRQVARLPVMLLEVQARRAAARAHVHAHTATRVHRPAHTATAHTGPRTKPRRAGLRVRHCSVPLT
eukprot:6336516-Prymnesium_polylepis.1